jgi:O-acetylserine/cysteine efflux transporter
VPDTGTAIASGAIAGLTSSVLWGISNVFAVFVNRRTNGLRTLAWWQVASVVLSAILIALGLTTVPADLSHLVPGLLAGAIAYFAYLALFTGLSFGPVAVVSPVVSANGGLTVILAVVLLGEQLQPVEVLGAVFATVGIMLAGVRLSRNWREMRFGGPGVTLGIVALVLFGFFNILSAEASRELGWQTAFVVSRSVLVTLALLGLLLPVPRILLARGSAQPDRRRMVALAVAGSSASAIGLAVFYVALGLYPAWLVGLTGSFSPIVVVAAGVFLFGERPSPVQWLGAGLILASLPLIAL